jgi:hypothetical protein
MKRYCTVQHNQFLVLETTMSSSEERCKTYFGDGIFATIIADDLARHHSSHSFSWFLHHPFARFQNGGMHHSKRKFST